jgi:hypothetical protein
VPSGSAESSDRHRRSVQGQEGRHRRTAVEAGTGLVSAQARTHPGDRPAVAEHAAHDHLGGPVIDHPEGGAGGSTFVPSTLNQPPPGFGFGFQRLLDVGVEGQRAQLVGEANAAQRLLALVMEEPGLDIAGANNMEGVDDIVEAD